MPRTRTRVPVPRSPEPPPPPAVGPLLLVDVVHRASAGPVRDRLVALRALEVRARVETDTLLVRLLAEGMSGREIGRLLGISERAVRMRQAAHLRPGVVTAARRAWALRVTS